MKPFSASPSARLRLAAAALFFCVHFACTLSAQHNSKPDTLAKGFRNPPDAARPWVFWMWLRVQTNRAAITADLQAMHAKGIEGAILYDSGVGGGMEATHRMVPGDKAYHMEATSDYASAHFTPLPQAAMPSWQPGSLELVRFAAAEAARLGIKLVLTVGLASTSGDISLADSQQRLVWSETDVLGGVPVLQQLQPLNRTVSPSREAIRSMVPERSGIGAHTGEQHPIAVFAAPSDGITPQNVIDLSDRTSRTGVLRWQAPAGRWRVYRFAYEPTYMTNAWGLYTDAMSAAALDHTWDATIGRLMHAMSPSERSGLYGIEDDSWEAGASTWTADFAAEFQKRRGYNLLPWLPVLTGALTSNADQAAAIRRDYYRTIADLIAERHYAHLAKLARRNSLVSFSEMAGPNSGQLDPEQNAAAIDVPMGEFWMPSQHRPTPDRRFLVHDAASAGHVYGHNVIACESLTSVGPHWEESLFDLKNTVDQGFTEGCNRIVVHNFSQSPSVTAKPGYVYFAGTHYNRNVTWWNETPAFNAYLGRTSFLLQQGHFAADILYYRGDGIGQLEQRKKALPVSGYDHDNIDLDALVHHLAVRNGRLILPDGMSYRVLVVPDHSRLAPEALHKIFQLVAAGATVVGPRPEGMDGLSVTAAQEQDFRKDVQQLWPDKPTTTRKVVHTTSLLETLQEMRLPPDVKLEGGSPDGELDWIHRNATDAEIYFVSSRWDPVEHIRATFRVSGRQPELWDSVTGTIRDATAFTQLNGLTTLPIALGPRGSVFVIFRKRIAKTRNGTAASNEPETVPLLRIDGPWQVAFDPAWGGPANIAFPVLTDWTRRPEESIRHYSGTASYRTSFTLPQLPQLGVKFLLNLGEVHEEAHVHVNGIDLGTVWDRPSQVDVTRAVHEGTNELDVDVTNLWPNRLIGDEALPADKRFTLTNAHKFGPSTPLLPSGLIGPVMLIEQKEAR